MVENQALGLSKSIDNVLKLVEAEIKLVEENKSEFLTIGALRKIIVELQQMKQFMSPKKFLPTYNYIVKDSCDIKNTLGDELLKIFHYYLKIKN